MKNPFEFAQRLYAYLSGKLSEQDYICFREELGQCGELSQLMEELQDKERIGCELRIMKSFDAKSALRRIEHKKRKGIRKLVAWGAVAAGICIVAGWWLLLQDKQQQGVSTIQIADNESAVVLETADGNCYGLDTLSSLQLAQQRIQVNNKKGTLQWLDVSKDNELSEVGYNKVTVPYGGTYSLVLPDGSKLYLNSGTVLEFPSRFSGSERRVKVKGEVYCEVARNENKPFVLEVAGMCVKVLGTVFNVKAYADEQEVYTTLVSGSVCVENGRNLQRKLLPGELATYARETGQLVVEQTDVYEQTAWKDGMFYFKQLPLEKILKIISRWYNLEVFYANSRVKEVVFNGKMPMYSSVEDILKKFEYADEVRFDLKGKTLTVY